MAVPIYRDEALVTLTAVDPPSSFAFPSRRIFLAKSKPTLSIGRTSRRNNSFEASESNAWIDSAVMSREHAEIRLDAQEHRVLIKDIGSLHGTFRNNVRLGHNQAQTLKDGDMIQFGIPIERGYETFPACIMRTTVQFGYMSSPEARPAVFTVPDDTDVEDVSSDEDVGFQHSSQILRDNKIHPARCHTSCSSSFVAAVDLTSNDQDAGCASPKPVDEVSPGMQNQNQETNDDQSNGWDAEKVDSESSQPRMPTPPGTIEILSDEEDVLFCCEDSYLDDDESDEDQDHPSLVDDLPDETVHSNFLHDIQGAPASVITQSITVQPFSIEPIVVEGPKNDTHAPYEAGNAERYFENSCLPPILDYSNTAMPPHPAVLPAKVMRLPSIFQTMPQTPLASSLSSRAAAEILGAKTGKYEYFAAREHNKSNSKKFSPVPVEDKPASASLDPSSWARFPGYQDAGSNDRNDETGTADEPCQHAPSKASEPDASRPEQAAWDLATHSNPLLVSGADFLNSPHKESDEPVGSVPLDLDETSAYQFEVSKQAIAQQHLKVKIKGLHGLVPASPESPSRPNKRKAINISQVTAEEELAEAEETPSFPSVFSSESKPAESTALANLSTVTVRNISSPECNDLRPTKRLRKAAEIFGYAALGGVAVMSALIATAPTL